MISEYSPDNLLVYCPYSYQLEHASKISIASLYLGVHPSPTSTLPYFRQGSRDRAVAPSRTSTEHVICLLDGIILYNFYLIQERCLCSHWNINMPGILDYMCNNYQTLHRPARPRRPRRPQYYHNYTHNISFSTNTFRCLLKLKLTSYKLILSLVSFYLKNYEYTFFYYIIVL